MHSKSTLISTRQLNFALNWKQNAMQKPETADSKARRASKRQRVREWESEEEKESEEKEENMENQKLFGWHCSERRGLQGRAN